MDREFLENKIAQLRINQKTHYAACERLLKLHYIFGIATLILATIALAFNFSNLRATHISVSWAIGLCTLAAALTSGTQTFSSFAGRASQHRSAGSAYGAILREFEFLASHSEAEKSETKIKQLLKEWKEVSEIAPLTNIKHRQKAGETPV